MASRKQHPTEAVSSNLTVKEARLLFVEVADTLREAKSRLKRVVDSFPEPPEFESFLMYMGKKPLTEKLSLRWEAEYPGNTGEAADALFERLAKSLENAAGKTTIDFIQQWKERRDSQEVA